MTTTTTTTTTTTSNAMSTQAISVLDNARIVYKGFNYKSCIKDLSAKGLTFMNESRFLYMYGLRLTTELDDLKKAIDGLKKSIDDLKTEINDTEDESTKMQELTAKLDALNESLNEKIARQRTVSDAYTDFVSVISESTPEKYIAIRAYCARYTHSIELHNESEIIALIDNLRLHLKNHSDSLATLSAGKTDRSTKNAYVTIKTDLQAIVSKILLDSKLFSDLTITKEYVTAICSCVKTETNFRKNSTLKANSGLRIASSTELLKQICQLIVLQVEHTTEISL